MDMCVLCVGGSDSGGGAGIQADIKTAAALGMHAACAVTCVTAQNTVSFAGCKPVDPEMIEAQIDAAFSDYNIAAVKVGMLASPQSAAAVASAIARQRESQPALHVVVDPVLAATVDERGAKEELAQAVSRYLVPLASVVTPNLPESHILANCCQQILSGATTADNKAACAPQEATDDVMAAWAARTMLAAGAGSVLVKGGHGNGADSVHDLLFAPASSMDLGVASPSVPGDDSLVGEVRVVVEPGCRDAFMSRPVCYTSKRLPGEFHGTGCVLSTAIACKLACGLGLAHAVYEARQLLESCLEHATCPGRGSKIIDPVRSMR